jgi:hypothetical protein
LLSRIEKDRRGIRQRIERQVEGRHNGAAENEEKGFRKGNKRRELKKEKGI